MKLNTVDIHLTSDDVFGRSAVVEMQHLKALFNATELFYSHSVIFFFCFEHKNSLFILNLRYKRYLNPKALLKVL